MGNRLGFFGDSVISFVVLCCITRYTKPVLFVHECTKSFQPNIFRILFVDHQVHHCITDPTDYGVPCHRRRSYTAVVRKDWHLAHPISSLFRLFISCGLDAGCFCKAGDAELEEIKEHMAANVSWHETITVRRLAR